MDESSREGMLAPGEASARHTSVRIGHGGTKFTGTAARDLSDTKQRLS